MTGRPALVSVWQTGGSTVLLVLLWFTYYYDTVLVSVWQTWRSTVLPWLTYSYNAVLVSVSQTQWHSWISIASKYWTHAQPGMRPFVSLGWAYIFGCSLCENQKVQDSPRTKGWRFHVVPAWCPNCQLCFANIGPIRVLVLEKNCSVCWSFQFP